jgi:UDP-2-acetamido-3-amino-2,3-dideoxy-glucuronate N-acetyltransferase
MSSPRSAPSPADRICVVGAGRWGKNHVQTLHQLGRLGGIVDVEPTRRAELAARYPEAEVFASVADAVERRFAGFVVATPAPTHYDVTALLLDRGHHVLVEKPIAMVAGEARDLVRRARQRGVNLMVGHVLLFHPAIRKMRELIEAGKIGRLQYLYSNRLNLGTVRTEENILWSFAPHDVSIFQLLVGSRPLAVESRGGVFLQPGIHDTTMTMLRYPDNVVGHIFLSWLHPYKEHRIVVVGSKGMLSFEDSSEAKDVLFYEKGIDWVQGEPVRRDGPTETIPYERRAPLAEELSYFIDRLVDGRPVEIATGEHGVEVLEILEQATADLLRSGEAASGSPAAVPPSAAERDYFVHPTSVVDDGAEVGAGSKIWHFSHVQPGARIGRGCVLGQNVNVGPNAVIGDHCKIQNNVSVYDGVILEDHVFCGPSMVFTNVRVPRSRYPRKGEGYDRTLIREGATLGANTTIVCGTTVGRHAFVAAGAVVSKDVPDFALVAGVPARRIGWICECGERLPGFTDRVSCAACSRGYRLQDGAVVPDVTPG